MHMRKKRLMLGPRAFTNINEPGHPFSAKYRATCTEGGQQSTRSGQIWRDSLGRLRKDIEWEGGRRRDLHQ